MEETGTVGVGSVELDIDEVPETDIQFDCPHCGKHLSIDPRGAGLVIVCTNCGKYVTVPIPEGLEIEDFDATPEELSFQLLNTRKALSRAEAMVEALSHEVEDLRAFKSAAEHREAILRERESRMLAKLQSAVKAQQEVVAVIESVVASSVPEV